MFKLRKILLHLLLLFCLILVGTILYYLSRFIPKSNDSKIQVVDCMGIALMVCVPSYIIYIIICKIKGTKNSVMISLIISIFSFAIVFLALSAFAPYGADYNNSQVRKSMLFFLLTALSLPLIEKIIFKNVLI
jgi:hypothetical protein